MDAIERLVRQPLKRALPDLERRDLIFVGGRYRPQDLVAAMGHYCETFRRDWLGIPATGRPVYLRYGEVHRVEGGQIVQSSCLWDVLDLIPRFSAARGRSEEHLERRARATGCTNARDTAGTLERRARAGLVHGSSTGSLPLPFICFHIRRRVAS